MNCCERCQHLGLPQGINRALRGRRFSQSGDESDQLASCSRAVQFACTFWKSQCNQRQEQVGEGLVGNSRINSLSSFIGLHWTARPIKRAAVKSNAPSSLPNSNTVSRLQLQSPGHRNQQPTSNIKSSVPSFALCKWLPALPQNQKAQPPQNWWPRRDLQEAPEQLGDSRTMVTPYKEWKVRATRHAILGTSVHKISTAHLQTCCHRSIFWCINDQDYTLWAKCPFSCTLHLRSINLRTVRGGDVGTFRGNLPQVNTTISKEADKFHACLFFFVQFCICFCFFSFLCSFLSFRSFFLTFCLFLSFSLCF
jgi:hypothetical protein